MGMLVVFWLFECVGLDFVVLEVGFGGCLDVVNLIDVDLVLIISIGLDYVDWLGDICESVVFEKVGILCVGKLVLCGDFDFLQLLLEQVVVLGVLFYLCGCDYDLVFVDYGWYWCGLVVDGQVLVLYDLLLFGLFMENVVLVLQVYVLFELFWQVECLVEVLWWIWVIGCFDCCDLFWNGQLCQFLLDVGYNFQVVQYLV